MAWWLWVLAALALMWAAFVLALFLAGWRAYARAIVGFMPDCLVLLHRLVRDGRLPRGQRLLLLALIGYLALPFDLVPDFIPVAGQLDDVLVVAFVLRRFLRAGGHELVHEHWPGPDQSLRLVLQVSGRIRAKTDE